jgi:hypothetical protein
MQIEHDRFGHYLPQALLRRQAIFNRLRLIASLVQRFCKNQILVCIIFNNDCQRFYLQD